MVYCQGCGCPIVNGGHKSHHVGSFSGSGICCDSCYALEQETEKNVFRLGALLVRLFVGLIVGIGTAIGGLTVLEPFMKGMSNAGQKNACIVIAALGVICWFALKFSKRYVGSKFVRFLLGLTAYVLFWFSICFGGVLWLMIKLNVE